MGQNRTLFGDECFKTGLAQAAGPWGVRSCAEGECEIRRSCCGSGLPIFQPMNLKQQQGIICKDCETSAPQGIRWEKKQWCKSQVAFCADSFCFLYLMRLVEEVTIVKKHFLSHDNDRFCTEREGESDSNLSDHTQ